MNLHEWITERVGCVEQRAQLASQCAPPEWVAAGSLVLAVQEEDGQRVADPVVIEAATWRFDAAVDHAALHNPAAVLRRCEADRRVLARHRLPPADDWLYPGCEGCGTTGEFDDIVTDNINDCPELLDLAHAHGITENDLAGLTRLERLGVVPVVPFTRRTVTPAMTTDQVPPALRGPSWRPHHH